MTSHRVERLAQELKKEVAEILDHEVKDPRLGFVSVVSVEIAADGSAAHIYVSSLEMAGATDTEAGDHTKAAAAALKSATGYIRRALFHRLKTRAVPELFFHVDESIAYGVRMTHEIDVQIAADAKAAAGRAPEDPDKYVKE